MVQQRERRALSQVGTRHWPGAQLGSQSVSPGALFPAPPHVVCKPHLTSPPFVYWVPHRQFLITSMWLIRDSL